MVVGWIYWLFVELFGFDDFDFVGIVDGFAFVCC